MKKERIRIGDLCQYMSRKILITESDPRSNFCWGYEVGSTEKGKYRKGALSVISKNAAAEWVVEWTD